MEVNKVIGKGITCWICGAPATESRSPVYTYGTYKEQLIDSFHRCYCSKCMKEVMEQEEAELNEYVRLKKREMFKKALATLEKQATDMYEYKEAIDVVDDYLSEHPDKFDSSYEVLAAIILVHNRIYSKMQYRIGRYQVDFLLPELFVVLEIDGERHAYNKRHDTKRDIQLQQALGDGWDIIRIPIDLLDKDAKKLPEAIYKVIDYRQSGRVNWRKLYRHSY